MNTPSHLIINLAILRRPTSPLRTWPILLGALIPDAALFVFYGWARWVQQLPERVIWAEAYYSQPWQDIFALGNSVPLALAAIALGLWIQQPGLVILAVSMVLHHLGDLPLHHDDAHRHFFPLSNQRFISPVSYWDREHYGRLGASIEIILVLAATLYLLPKLGSTVGKALLTVTVVLSLGAYLTLQIL
jgi:hypothetical protein